MTPCRHSRSSWDPPGLRASPWGGLDQIKMESFLPRTPICNTTITVGGLIFASSSLLLVLFLERNCCFSVHRSLLRGWVWQLLGFPSHMLVRQARNIFSSILWFLMTRSLDSQDQNEIFFFLFFFSPIFMVREIWSCRTIEEYLSECGTG